MVIVEVSPDSVPKRLTAGQSDVVRAVIVIEHVEPYLITEVTDAKAVAVRANSPEDAKVAARPDNFIDIPEQAVALDEPRLRLTPRPIAGRRHATTITFSESECNAPSSACP